MVLSRPECFRNSSIRQQIFSYDKSGKEFPAKEYYIQKYSESHINQHVEKFVAFLKQLRVENLSTNSDNLFCMTKCYTKDSPWEDINNSKYYEWFRRNRLLTLPQLKELAANPLILTIILLTLPGISIKVQNDVNEISRICSTEVGLYDQLFEQWFQFQKNKIATSKLPLDLYNILEHLPAYYEVYAQNLAIYILSVEKKEIGILTENYVLEEASTLNEALVDPVHNEELRTLRDIDQKHQTLKKRENIMHLRSGCPLYFYKYESSVPVDKLRCKFIHISLLEYLISREVFKGLRAKFNYFIQTIILDEESYRQNQNIVPNDTLGITYQPINDSRKVNPVILQMLADRARIDKEFSDLLLEIVKTSTKTTTIRQMSANAMTILVLSGRSLSGQNFRDVQIPKADLRNGIFAGTDFRGANLTKVRLTSSWLLDVKLQGACLEGVNVQQFSIRHDREECQRPYIPICNSNFLYCSYLGRIVQCDWNTGETTKKFVLPNDPNNDPKYNNPNPTLSRLDVLIINRNELIVWNLNSWTIFRWNVDDGELLTPICDRIPSDGGTFQGTYSESISRTANSIDLLTYGPDEEGVSFRDDDIVRLYNLEDLAVRIITVQTLRRRLEPCNERKFCFPIIESIPIKVNFPIACTFKCCDLTEKSGGLFALHTTSQLIIYSLLTGHIIYKEASQVEKLKTVAVKFNPIGDFLVIFCSDENIFQLLDTISWTKTDLMNVISRNRSGVLDSFVFSSDSRKLATEHTFGVQSQILLWTLSSANRSVSLTSRIVNYHRYTNVGIFCPQFTFCRNDKAIAYYTTAKHPEISIVEIDDIDYNHNNMHHSRFEQRYKKVLKICVSLNQKNGAILLQHVGENWSDNTKRRDVHIFSFPYSSSTAIRHVRHDSLYKSDDKINFIDSISFDRKGECLFLCGSDLKIFIFSLTGDCERVINLCPEIETFVSSGSGKLYFSSWFSITQSKLLIKHSGIFTNGLFRLYNIHNIGHNWLSSEDISCSYKNKKIDKMDGLTMDENGDWIAGWYLKSLYVWSTKNLKKVFYYFQPNVMRTASHYFMHDVNFVRKSSSNFLIVSSSQLVFILKVSSRWVSLERTINCKKPSLFDKLESSTDYPFCFLTMGLFDDFQLYGLKGKDHKEDIDFSLWYRVDASKIVVRDTSEKCCLIFNAGIESGELNFTCIQLKYFEKSWKMLWSYKPCYKFKARNCNIGQCYIGNSGSTLQSLKGFGTIGSPMSRLTEEYVPYADLFTKCIPNEKCSDVMEPIVKTNRNYLITKDEWVISAVMKTPVGCCRSTKCSTNHVWLIIEGVRDCRRFVIEGHKGREDKERNGNVAIITSTPAIITCRPIGDPNKLLGKRAGQWKISCSEGETIIRSIQCDQQREDLQYNLLRQNCVEWCRSKLQLYDKNIGRRNLVFDLVITPGVLIP